MKVSALQQFLSQLVPLMEATNASQAVIAELKRTGQCLEPFKEASLADFNEFLRNADECVRTNKWPQPGKKATTKGTKAPKITVAEAAQKFLALKERATDPSLENHMIDLEIDAFNTLTMPQLKDLAKEVGQVLPSKAKSKNQIISEIKRVIKELKESHLFNQHRPSSPAQKAGAAITS
jgi:hypothetical protein